MRGFAVNFAFNLGGTALSSLATLFVVAALPPSGWGLSAAILGTGQLAGSALSYGSQIEHVRRYARLSEQLALRASVRDSAARITVAVVTLVVGCVFLTFSQFVGGALICAAGVFTGLGTTNYWISMRRFVGAGLLLILEKGLGCAVLVAAVLTHSVAPVTLPIVFGGAGLIVGLVGFVLQLSIARPRPRLPKWSDVSAHWRGTAYFGLSSLAPSILLLDSTVVLGFAGLTQAGYFSVGSKLVAPLSVATTSIVAALLPYLSAATHRRLPSLNLRIGIPLALVFAGLVSLLLVLASWWVPLLFGSTYAGAVWPVRFYLLNVIVVLFTRTIATILQAWGDERFVAGCILAQVITALAGIAVGATWGGAFWASIAVLATNIVLVFVFYLRLTKLKEG